jgi:low affinity Fe/Cu permease
MHGVETETVILVSRELIEKALIALQQTKNWTRDLEEMSTKMDSAIVSLGDHTNNLKMGIAMAEGPVNQTQNHADDLEDQAKFLEKYVHLKTI